MSELGIGTGVKRKRYKFQVAQLRSLMGHEQLYAIKVTWGRSSGEDADQVQAELTQLTGDHV